MCKALRVKLSVSNKLHITSPDDILTEKLETQLTFDNPQYAQVLRFSPYARTNVPAQICLLEVENGRLSVPRGFDYSKIPAKHRPDLRRGQFSDNRCSVPVKFPPRLLPLNSEQTLLLQATYRAHLSNQRPLGTFLVVSSTSTGKTILQASLAKKLGQRTLVLCKTNLIQKAWKDDLQKLFGISPKEIGVIQQQHFKIGEHFTLSSLATLHRRQHRWDEIFALFGTVIMDEVHLLPADSVLRFVSACPCRYLIGATATIKKDDEKKRRIVYSYFGPPVMELESVVSETQTSLPISEVRAITTNFQYETTPDNFDYIQLVDAASGNDARNCLITKQVLNDWSNGHCVLVTTNRVAHVHLLADELTEAGISDVQIVTGSSNSARKYAKLAQDLADGTVRCVVATDQLIAVGANLPPIDRLHVAMPIKDHDKLKQLLGRIRRKSPNKVDARVTYYVDKGQSYFYGVYCRTAAHVFREMQVPGYKNLFMA